MIYTVEWFHNGKKSLCLNTPCRNRLLINFVLPLLIPNRLRVIGRFFLLHFLCCKRFNTNSNILLKCLCHGNRVRIKVWMTFLTRRNQCMCSALQHFYNISLCCKRFNTNSLRSAILWLPIPFNPGYATEYSPKMFVSWE